jgi:hypothetical protein
MLLRGRIKKFFNGKREFNSAKQHRKQHHGQQVMVEKRHNINQRSKNSLTANAEFYDKRN